ncbi:peptidase [Sphingomonas sp. Leaf412]|uniref:retropepsin-like aspartic protease family protein n=1 Tax=Sphingomonas sp. Leaf412 TaxID=1736370 RepID=UPI0006F618A8|nr:TIGR02281 family clan AA aspartic protease [Sphingomonas sp. Leaf412]KQT32086.1 peptidase [Sphingomonas sp. Leaf412]
MAFDFGIPSPILIALGGLLIVMLVARRIPILGRLVSLAFWIVAIGSLVLLTMERERLDPWLARVAAKLNLESQEVAGSETRIRMSPDGHFYVRAQMGGTTRRLLVDSGATITALSPRTAELAGVEPRTSPFPVVLRTANGNVQAQTGQLAEMRFGNVVARDLTVVVSPAFGDVDVLGMNFLSRLKSWRVEGRTLILTPHHPQAKAA